MALINLRNALMAGKRLPYDAEVEFLESTGTQYIDLGTVVPPDADFEFMGSIVRDMVNGCIFGETYAFNWGAGNPGYSLVTTSGGKVYAEYGGSSTVLIIGMTTVGLGETFTASLVGSTFQINGQSVATVTRADSFTKTVSSMTVFKRNYIVGNSSTLTLSAVRISRLKFGNLFDFIPVRKGTVGYLYDRVSGQLFGNDGTGDFIIGPDASASNRGYKRQCVRRSYRRSLRPSYPPLAGGRNPWGRDQAERSEGRARFWHAAHLPRTWKEVA